MIWILQGFFFAELPCFSFHGRFHHFFSPDGSSKTRVEMWRIPVWGLQNGVLYFRFGILIIRVGINLVLDLWVYYAFLIQPQPPFWRVWNSIDTLPFSHGCGIWWPHFLEEIVGTSATTVVGSLMTQSDGDNQAAGKLRKPIDVRIVEIDVLRYEVLFFWMNNLRAKMRI